jgi:hypothetical protein
VIDTYRSKGQMQRNDFKIIEKLNDMPFW